MRKTNKPIGIFLAVVMLLSCLSCLSGLDAFALGVQPLPTEPGSVLTSGQYVVTETLSITATEPGQSGLVIDKDATVEIFIAKDCNLSVTGANAEGRNGAGAGICVPKGSTLILSGYGTLLATGGDAADGGNGSDGKNGASRIDGDDAASGGNGGNGGYGGGGAGAGIGGTGGKGGIGGNGGAGAYVYDDDITYAIGSTGDDAGPGEDGAPMGKVRIEILSYTAKSGWEGKTGADAKSGSSSYYEYTTFTDGSYGAAGGAGAGGLGGKRAFDIGPGGGGGGGGASGGGGAAVCDLRQKITNPSTGGVGAYTTDGYTLHTSPMVEFEDFFAYIVNGGYCGLCGRNGTALSGTDIAFHFHDFSKNWAYDDDSHWHPCTRPDCRLLDYSLCLYEKASFGAHTDINDDCFCDICGRLDADKKNLTDTKSAAERRLYDKAGEKPSAECIALLNEAIREINAAKTPDEVQTVYETYLAALEAQLEAEAAQRAFDDAKAQAVREVTEAAGEAPSDATLELLDKAVASINEAEDYKALRDAKEHGLLLIMSQIHYEASEESAERLASVEQELDALRSELAEIRELLVQMSTVFAEKQEELEGKEEEIAQLRALVSQKTAELTEKEEELARLKAAEGEQPEEPTQPSQPEQPSVCEKCGKTHADGFFGQIACFFNRIMNFFKKLFK